MFRIISATLVYLLFCTPSFSNFKEIKKKAKINNPEIIFPVSKNPNRCMTKMYSNPMTNPVTPIPEVKAPKGYGLDNRFKEHYKGLKILNVHVVGVVLKRVKM